MSYSKVPYIPLVSADIAVALFELAEKAARRAARAGAKALDRGRPAGQILRPGPETPLWSELLRQVRPLLRPRGSKASLARLLDISRQRLHVCVTSPTACLDAERALLLLCWVGARQSGRHLLGG